MVLAGVNDLATINPELARQWHPTKNGDLTPRDVLAGSRRKVWWICEHGHEWQADVSSRNHGTGCPVCAGKKVISGENDFASQYPELARQWHPTKNGSLRPDQVTPSSNKKVWWICDKGHEYQAVIASRTRRHGGCPYCQNVKVLSGFNDLATNIQRSLPNGTQQKTATSHQNRFCQAVAAEFGGSVRTATAGKPSSIPAQARRTAAVRSALAMPLASAARATRRILKRWKNESEQRSNKEEDIILLKTPTARECQCALALCRYNVDDYGCAHDSLRRGSARAQREMFLQ